MASISPVSAETTERIERFIDEHRQRHDVPGLSVAITDDAALLYANAFGARDIEANEPFTPDTRVSIASVTKLYTALAILHLASEGDLAVDDEIREYTEFWTDVPGEPITVAELLSHSSGMPADGGTDRETLFAPSPPTSPMVTPEDTKLHTNAAAEQLRYAEEPPHLMYNTRGYQILGEIVGNVSGQSFKDYVETELFEAMGMADSQVGFDELAEEGDDVAHGYVLEDGEPVATSFDLNRDIHPPHAGGGILSTVTDMAKTARLYLNDGRAGEAQLVDADLLDRACSPQSPAFETIDGAGDHAAGFGPRVIDFPGGRLAYHTGTTPRVSRAYLGVHRGAGIGVTLAVNTPDVPIGVIGKGITALLLGEDPAASVPKLGIASKVRRVTGTYEGFRGSGGYTVTVGGNDSHIRLGTGDDDQGLAAYPTSTDPDDLEFRFQSSHGTLYPVTFHETAGGLELRFNTQRLTRV